MLLKEPALFPKELGHIEETHQGVLKPTVILVRDAHAVTSAQLSIQKIMEEVAKKYGVRASGVEGATGDFDSVLLRSFPDKTILNSVLSDYLKRGELTGPGTADFLNAARGKTSGLETWELYEKNYFAWLRAWKVRQAALNEVEVSRKTMDGKRLSLYSKELNAFYEQCRDFRHDPSKFYALLNYLAGLKISPRNPSAYFELPKLLKFAAQESGLEPAKLAQEIQKTTQDFEARCKIRLNPAHAGQYGVIRQQYGTGAMDAADYLSSLEKLSVQGGCAVDFNPALKDLAENADQVRLVSGTSLMDEIESYLAEVRARLAKNPAEKALEEDYEKLYQLEDLAKLEMSRKSYDSLLSRRQDFSPWFSRETIWKPMLDFYALAIDRDRALFENLEKRIQKEKLESFLTVLGGFHEEGLKRQMKAKGYSYLVITPHIRSLEGKETYENLMLGKFSYRKNLQNSFYETFVRVAGQELARSLPPSQFGRTMKTWRDDILRYLSEEGRLAEAWQ
ncbi:MAG: hypothetical protein EXS63_06575, partial [Candidatus Omnitrophica bacterium]|nr:hypothetical protein [Candidatus Omnitrophota bacterium]